MSEFDCFRIFVRAFVIEGVSGSKSFCRSAYIFTCGYKNVLANNKSHVFDPHTQKRVFV